MRRLLTRVPGVLLDTTIVILLAIILAIVVTGGGAVDIAGLRVRARTVENPLGIVAVLVVWWLWLPIGVLSLLPHKEARYLIPVTPFLSIAAARGFLRAIAWVQRDGAAGGWRRWSRDLLAPALLLSVLHEMGGWRLVRSNEGVRLAQALRSAGVMGVAAQDPWRLGGHVYLWPHEPIIELPPETLDDGAATRTAVEHVGAVALRSRTARTIGDAVLQPLGFERVPQWRGEDYVWYTRRR